jgi:hypothetical protein
LFDAAIADGLKRVAVPAGLKAAILANRRIVKPLFWQDWRMRAAAAAAVVLAASALAIAKVGSGTTTFAEFRERLVAEAWGGERHLDLESSAWNEVGRWLAAQNAVTNFNLPPELAGLRLHGASVVALEGQRIPLICLADGPKHLHLFVVTRASFRDLPHAGMPDFENCGGWKTASWQQGDKTFVLTGMKYQAFVNKFRKAGRWTMSG